MSENSTRSRRAGTAQIVFSKEVSDHAVVVGADVIAAHPDWLFVVAFDVGEGRTDLIGRSVIRKPQGWPQPPGESILHDFLKMFEVGVPGVGHLTTVVARSAATAEIERFVREKLRSARRAGAPTYAEVAWGEDVEIGPDLTRRAGDLRRAKVARRYVEIIAETTDPPKPILAKELNLAVNTINSLLHEARMRGLLTSHGQGKTGGDLTPLAEKLLAGEES